MGDKKLACITLDIESDFTVKSNPKRQYGLFDEEGQFERFTNLCREYEVKLSCFVVGSAIEDRTEFIEELRKSGAEFGSHSRTHDLTAQTSEREVVGGIDHFADYFGNLPMGYRSPRGKYNADLLEMLSAHGVKYDSSVIPSIRPGVYSNMRKPHLPFRWKELPLLEIPISVTSGLPIPLSLSYMKVLGKKLFRMLLGGAKTRNPLVFLIHPMDLVYSEAAFETLSTPWALAYSRHRSNSWEYFEILLKDLKDAGYGFVQMSDVYQVYHQMDLEEVCSS